MTPRDLYLNHAGTSWPKPPAVAEAGREAMSISPTQWPRRFADAHQEIAEFFGVGSPDQILLTPGCTSALAVGIGDASIPANRRVLTSRWEHHALHRPLLKRASADVRLEYIPAAVDPQTGAAARGVDLDWLQDALSDGEVGLVAITAACNVTGELLPCQDVIRLAHDYGAKVLIDAAQVVGWLPLDPPQWGADMVAFGGHKGLQAPWGVGGLYLSEDVQMECASAACELPVGSHTAGHRPGYCDVGSVDQFALAGLHAAIRWLRTQDMETNLSKARKQVQRIRQAAEEIEGLHVLGAFQDGMPTIAMAVAGCSSGAVAGELGRQGLVVGSGLQCAPLAHETLGTLDSGLVRLSVGVGQSDEEVDEAIARLRLALHELGHRDSRTPTGNSG